MDKSLQKPAMKKDEARKMPETGMKAKHDVRIGCLCAAACEVIFGLSYVFTKDATGQASELALLGWRFFIAAAVMLVCTAAGLVRIRLKGKRLRPLLLVALFSPVLYFIGETCGISRTTASESGAFLACIPVLSLIASSLILKKKPRKIQAAGILITLTGVLAAVFAAGAAVRFSAAGYAALLIAAVSYALYSVSVEKAQAFTGAEITFIMLLAGAAVFVALAFIEAFSTGSVSGLLRLPFENSRFLAACLYQGIGCSVLAFFLSNVAIAKIGVNRTASFIGIATAVSILAGVLILREPFTLFQGIGVVLIVAGVYLANSRSQER